MNSCYAYPQTTFLRPMSFGYTMAQHSCSCLQCTWLLIDPLLLERKYYYFVPSKPQYEICRLFSEWPFPHESYAEVWGSGILDSGVRVELETDGASLVIRERDGVCAISGCSDSLSMSHIVPIAESDWVCVLIIISLVIYVELCCVSCTSTKWTRT